MTIKLFAAAAVVALSAFATQAQAVQTWTVTTTGTIDYGSDTTGVFGLGGNLAGFSFTQSVTAITDYAGYAGEPEFYDTITINGKSVTFISRATEASNQQIDNGVGKASGGPDIIYSVQEGHTASGDYLNATQYVLNFSNAFVPATGYGQTIAPINVSDASFLAYVYFDVSQGQFGNGSQIATFTSRSINTISVNVIPDPVPEPETYAMLLAGLGLVGFAARRKRVAA